MPNTRVINRKTHKIILLLLYGKNFLAVWTVVMVRSSHAVHYGIDMMEVVRGMGCELAQNSPQTTGRRVVSSSCIDSNIMSE